MTRNKKDSCPLSIRLGISTLFVSPFILFFSTTNTLYLGNQQELDYQLSVYLPFLNAFLISFSLGLLLYFMSSNRFGKMALGAYYFLGPYFLVYAFLRARFPEQMDTLISSGIMLLVFIGCVFVMTKMKSWENGAKILLGLGLVLVLTEGLIFMQRFHPNGRSQVLLDWKETSPTKEFPNIYHLVLDEYQMDLFEMTRTEDLEARLAGFKFYPDATTVYGRTIMSLATVFNGRAYDYQMPQQDFWWSAYNSKHSFLHKLIQAGYQTAAFLHGPSHQFEQRYFQTRFQHSDIVNSELNVDPTKIFMKLWMFRYLPKPLSKYLIPFDEFSDLQSQKLLPPTGPALSYAGFQKFLDFEKDLPATGRYTFLHLLVPHFPNIFTENCNCEFDENGGMTKTSVLEHTRCANKIIVDLVERLKELGRFSSSLIIIHGDHGSRYTVKDGRLAGVQKHGLYSRQFSHARSRVLLLFKPPGRGTDHPFSTSDAEVTLLDIAPTIIESLNISGPTSYKGLCLTDPNLPQSRGIRQYHWFSKRGNGEQTNQLTRYIIDAGNIEQEMQINLAFHSYRRELRLEFESNTNQLLEFNAMTGLEGVVLGELVRQKSASLSSRHSQVLEATGNDPFLILPELDTSGLKSLMIKIDLTCPLDSVFEFSLFNNEHKQGLLNHQKLKTLKGRNVIYFKVNVKEPLCNIHLNPGRTPGIYKIHEMVVNGE